MTLYTCLFHGTYTSGRSWSCRQHFSSSAVLATVETDWKNAVSALWTSGANALQAFYPTTTVLTGTKTYTMSVIAGTPGKIIAVAGATDALSLAGTSANDGLPDQNSVLVSLRTAGLGPNNRGRTKLPAVDETIVVGDLLGTTPAGKISTAMTALRSTMAAAGHTQVLWNDRSTARDPAIGTTKVVTLSEVDRVIRTQRNRVRKEAAIYV